MIDSPDAGRAGSTSTRFRDPLRSRVLYLSAAAVVVVLGLASRRYPLLVPATLGKYPGDALWALMVFLVAGALLRSASTIRIALVALGLAYAVELSQLCQTPWLNAIRRTTPGHLMLGSHFHALDLIAYAVGVACGIFVERIYFLRLARRGPQSANSPHP